MQVERLRLVGFKSFVDAAELAIGPGLTGIVGPNGCGKSNLVEALRWVMGETSAKRLRGGEMDDVIFAGTGARPPRNIAEVVLTIDNRGRQAPFAFNDRDEIEIVRRIERGGGSAYRVNGREARARDVQILFADAASGAHSAALLSQGRVAALIEAKPAERRLLLEEAAGTAGLHARRRESELRLKAAEDNLARLDDVVLTMDSQLEALKKQARQAQRYRRLAEQIRRAEALLLRARWLAAAAAAAENAAELRAAERAVAAATEESLALGRERETAEAALPPLRLAEAAAGAELQRLRRARESLEDELARVAAAQAEAERRLSQLAADLAREDEHRADAEAALARLSQEREVVAASDAGAAPAREAAQARLAEAAARLAAAEAQLQEATEKNAAAAAQHAALASQRRELAERRARLEARREEARRQEAALNSALPPSDAREAATAAVAAAQQQAAACRAAAAASEKGLGLHLAADAEAGDAARAAEGRLARLQAEAAGLRAILAAAGKPADAAAGPPAFAAVTVADGFEAALGALFDDELSAPIESATSPAGRAWIKLPALVEVPPLPPGARAFSEIVAAPAALARRLAFAGWVEDAETGRHLQPLLAPGQRLVDRNGRLWRWDGFVRTAPGRSAAAEAARHKNRLARLDREIAGFAAEAQRALTEAQSARRGREDAADADRQARAELRAAEAALTAAAAAEAGLARRAVETEARLAALAEAAGKFAADLAETASLADRAERELLALPDPLSARAGLDAARARAATARAAEAEAKAAIDRLDRETAGRRERLAAIEIEEGSWQKRREGSQAQRAALLARRTALDEEMAGLAARPQAIAAESERLLALIEAAAGRCRDAADALARGEGAQKRKAEAAHLADEGLAQAREGRARAQVQCTGAEETRQRLSREIRERLDCAPEGLAPLAGVGPDEPAGDPEETARRLERLMREREALGPVNLVAEAEAAEVEARIEGLVRERGDLREAILRLRRGIAALDEEGRKRLVAAFEEVNAHFAQLFDRLFGGGKAYIEMVDDEDPLAAGLEIMASPPGKRLQALSLLSGGEQALTALALVFAMFLTNPAPVCVLDEVDAPLDDANVDRLCCLVGEIADTTRTRFVVVTHHRITMARVDRLFGVTMAERGVSQLVSVDLARAAALRQTA
ncbi:MAG TPA: chromosome segregation protein SMC [Stellaceae bacterium]|nr:chromosome segregation protein SMC [Stellaceae bacterium]